jgi:predicted acyltransferase
MPTQLNDQPSKDHRAEQSATGRLLSLDAFRGLTILAMILVNNPGRWGDQYWPLAHAPWHGWTPTDLIFPFFLFIVGTSLAYSLRKYRDGAQIAPAVYWRIVQRTALLILLGWLPGLLVRAISYFNGSADSLDLETLRLPGVLVRIALVYFATSLIVLHVPLFAQVALGVLLLLGYWAMLAWHPDHHDYQGNLSPEGNMVRVVDIKLIGEDHMYTRARTEKTDPEGLLSTLPAIVTSLLGYWTGLFIQRRGVNYRTAAILLACGIACAAIGQGWHVYFPVNKKLWTSSFVLLTGGLGMVVLAGCLLKFDLWGWRRLARPFEIVGINAIFVFVASGLLGMWLGRWRIAGMSAHDWIYSNFFTSWLTDPKLASLGFALAVVAFWWIILWIMSRLGWTIRV